MRRNRENSHFNYYKSYKGGTSSIDSPTTAEQLVYEHIIPTLLKEGVQPKDTPRALEKAQDVLLPKHSEHLDKIAELMPRDWGGKDIPDDWKNGPLDAIDYAMEVYMESGLKPSSGNRGVNGWIIFISDPGVKEEAEQLAKESGRNASSHKSEMWKTLSDEDKQPYKDEAQSQNGKSKLGGRSDPSLNPTYCDGHISQCQDAYGTCQDGGFNMDASINPSFCDAHVSQCKDNYTSCGGGLSDKEMYRDYKRYKKLYKQLTRK